LERTTSKELSEWQAYYSIEPFGEERADLRNAMLCTLVANAMRGKNSKAMTIKDFMPDFEPKKPMTDNQIKTILMGLC